MIKAKARSVPIQQTINNKQLVVDLKPVQAELVTACLAHKCPISFPTMTKYLFTMCIHKHPEEADVLSSCPSQTFFLTSMDTPMTSRHATY